MNRYILLIAFLLTGCSKYSVGDCFQVGGDYTYKVKRLGKYSLIAEKMVYANRFEEVLINQNDIKKSIQVDCFESFEPKDPENR